MRRNIVCSIGIVLFVLLVTGCSTSGPELPAKSLAKRLLADKSSSFVFEEVPSQTDYYELEQISNGKILIKGNNGVSMARGLNHYLKSYCYRSVSWCGNNMSDLPAVLPSLSEKIRVEASVPYRYYLNYCTYSYSMAFWTWEQWEREIDRMALQGVNTVLMAVNGQFAVWQNTLKRLGFSQTEIDEFMPGAGYEAWWLMGNLEGFGGPVSQEYIDRQTQLQKKVLSRIRELGMQPVFQGFYGMVPNILKKKYPDAHIIEQGKWLAYQRPALLDPADPLFGKIASIYYEEQKKLFGDAVFFGGDPFHEGGRMDGIDVPLAAQKIVQEMRKFTPDAIWILQGWQHNPAEKLLAGLKQGDVIILDLMACERPQWKGVESYGKKKGHMQHPWIWCALPNFGGKTGQHGKMSSYSKGPVVAKRNEMGKNMCGIGVASEGIGTNPIVYDMVFDMAWKTDTIDIASWLRNYVGYRYGKSDENCYKAWEILSNTIYECHNAVGGPIESYICARPSEVIASASAWGFTKLFYSPMEIVRAWELMWNSNALFAGVDTYEYDIVDLTRQVLSDYAKFLHENMIDAFQKKDKKAFLEYSNEFLTLIRDMDNLLSTRKEFMLATWLEEAENAGCTPDEKLRFVANAKRQITTWTDIESVLHDYANKEWSGLLVDFYLPRWEVYVNYKTNLLYNKPAERPDYVKMEQDWVNTRSTYLAKINSENTIDVVRGMYEKYHDEIERAYMAR